jgi:hypothetical protein
MPRSKTKNFDYQIAIPSYKRPHILTTQTLQTLQNLGNDLSNVTVFTANSEETAIYKTTTQAVNLDVKVVTAVPGLTACRVWYNTEYYDEGTPILNLDDDIAKICQKSGEKNLADYEGTLDDIVRLGFDTCEKHNARLWGINAALNGLFMKNTTSVGLRYICGIFHGSYAGDPALCGKDREIQSSGEDFETTLRSFKLYGKVVRLDGYAPKTKYFAQGGMQAELGGKAERDAHHRAMLMKIAAEYPDLAKVYDKAGGVANIRLKTVTEAKIAWPERIFHHPV